MITLSDSSPAPAQKIEPFVYRTLQQDDPPAVEEPIAEEAPPPPPGVPEDEVQRRELAAREQGRREAETALRAELQQTIQAEREIIAAAVQEFERQKNAYYQGIEQEIV